MKINKSRKHGNKYQKLTALKNNNFIDQKSKFLGWRSSCQLSVFLTLKPQILKFEKKIDEIDHFFRSEKMTAWKNKIFLDKKVQLSIQ